MSLKALPLLYLNLGGEMLFILDQRLRAQNIPKEKTTKVLVDIIGTMYNAKFIDELFRPDFLYSKKAWRSIFERIAHASIMKLNHASMDKLYDLMIMAVKYQILSCKRPQDIFMVTLNHVDAIRVLIYNENKAVDQMVEYVYKNLKQTFATLSAGEFMFIRQTLLEFFQDIHIRVSIFLRDKVQNNNGRFIFETSGELAYGMEPPGKIKLFEANGQLGRTVDFSCGAGSYRECYVEGSYDMIGDRAIKLGTNMYSGTRPSDTTVSYCGGASSASGSGGDYYETNVPDPRAKEQLDFLTRLIGMDSKKSSKQPEFKLNLFNSTDEEDEQSVVMTSSASGKPGYNIVNIDASKKKPNAELSRIMDDMNIQSTDDANEQEDDLLDLMDRA